MHTEQRDYSGLTFSNAHSKDELLEEHVLTTTVDAFVDQVLSTLMHYKATGRLHAKGITAIEAHEYAFPPALGSGYSRDAVTTLQYAAIHAIAAFEEGRTEDANNDMNELFHTITALHAPQITEIPAAIEPVAEEEIAQTPRLVVAA